MNALLKWVQKNPLFLMFLLLCASFAASATPTAFDFRTATTMPADFLTIYNNAIGAIALLTGGGSTLTALKAALGLVAGLIRSMFAA